MKYLLIVLVCYAVKCEDVRNKYFVVKMPEDSNRQQDVKDFKKSFQVYWNIPTMQCASKKIPFNNLYEKFGIIQNDNDRFIGDKIVVIYNETDFPSIIKNKISGKNVLRNGGVPQEGNLENHLIAFENNLNNKIPDPYYDGIAIIDFESWRPVFRQNFGSLLPHRTLSMEIEKRLHNWWPKMWIEREATLRFEAAARRFMQTTLSVAKEIRPNALWGYYGFPYCFNVRGRDMAEKCAANIDKENDSIYWLWAESTALFPSIYSSVSLTSSQLSSLIKGRVKETSRVRGGDTPIFPYFWLRYRDAGFINEKDLEVALATLYRSKASGFIIWGSSNDVNTVEKCKKLFKYVDTVLGPKIARYTKPVKKIHKDNLQNKDIYKMKTSTDFDGLYYSRSMQSLNTDKSFSTETLSDFNKFTESDENRQSTNNYEMSSTETNQYNEYPSTDDSQTLHNFDFTLSSLESSTIHSEYMNANPSIKTRNNDEISSTESSITYNKHTYNDKNSQLFNNDDILSTETSKVNTNTGQSTQTLFNEIPRSYTTGEVSQTANIDKQTPNFSNEYSDGEKKFKNLIIANQIFLSESSTVNYKDIDHNTRTLNNDDIYLTKISTVDKSYKNESSQTLNNHIFNDETNIFYNKYSETEEHVPTLNNDDVISTLESSTIYNVNRNYTTKTFSNDEKSLSKFITDYNIYIDNSLQNSNDSVPNEETTIVYNKCSKTEKDVPTLDNDDVISTSDSSTIYDENKDFTMTTLNNSTTGYSYRDKSSQTSNDYMFNEDTTIVYNKYSKTEGNVQTLNNDDVISTSDSSTIYNKFKDYITTNLNNNKTPLSRVSAIGNSYIDKNSQTLSNHVSNEETSNVSSEYFEENVATLNNDDVMSASNSSTTYDKNRDYTPTTLSNDKMSMNNDFDNSYKYESSQTSNNHISNKETTIVYNEYSETENHLQILSNDHVLSSTESSTINNKNRDHRAIVLVNSFFNNDKMPSTDTGTYSKYINTDKVKKASNDKEILSEGTSTIFDHFNEFQSTESLNNIKYLKETSPPSDEISHTDRNTDDLIEIGQKITKKNCLDSNGHDGFINNIPNSSEDQSDYLITVDNSTNKETLLQPQYQNSTNIEDDYLIIVQSPKNKQNLRESMSNSKLETIYYQTQADIYETATKSELFSETANDLDLVVKYVDKKTSVKGNEELTTKASFHSIKLSNSGNGDGEGERSDDLIIVDNSTNTETYSQLENTNITTADNDYLIIAPDYYSKKSDHNLNLDTTSQTKSDLETDTKLEDFSETLDDVDPVVEYISKTINNMKLKDSMSTGYEFFNNNELLSSDDDESDYLIKLLNLRNKETDKQYEYTESTTADNDYIIIIKNIDD